MTPPRVEGATVVIRSADPVPREPSLVIHLGATPRVVIDSPPPRLNLTRFHGVFAPGGKLKPWVRPGQAEQPEPEAKAAGAQKGEVEHTSNRPPRLTWAGLLRRKFELDVFACGR